MLTCSDKRGHCLLLGEVGCQLSLWEEGALLSHSGGDLLWGEGYCLLFREVVVLT